MNAVMFATWIAVGLLTGWLAGTVMKDGGHGLVRDLVLGVIGSSAATSALTALDGASEVGLFATVFVAFAGAALVIIVQRKIWYAQPERVTTMTTPGSVRIPMKQHAIVRLRRAGGPHGGRKEVADVG